MDVRLRSDLRMMKQEDIDYADRMRKLHEARHQKMVKEFGREPKQGFHFVRNLQSNGVVELKDGTPNCCDPSSETYWSM